MDKEVIDKIISLYFIHNNYKDFDNSLDNVLSSFNLNYKKVKNCLISIFCKYYGLSIRLENLSQDIHDSMIEFLELDNLYNLSFLNKFYRKKYKDKVCKIINDTNASDRPAVFIQLSENGVPLEWLAIFWNDKYIIDSDYQSAMTKSKTWCTLIKLEYRKGRSLGYLEKFINTDRIRIKSIINTLWYELIMLEFKKTNRFDDLLPYIKNIGNKQIVDQLYSDYIKSEYESGTQSVDISLIKSMKLLSDLYSYKLIRYILLKEREKGITKEEMLRYLKLVELNNYSYMYDLYQELYV
jgi:hypothetical protein